MLLMLVGDKYGLSGLLDDPEGKQTSNQFPNFYSTSFFRQVLLFPTLWGACFLIWTNFLFLLAFTTEFASKFHVLCSIVFLDAGLRSELRSLADSIREQSYTMSRTLATLQQGVIISLFFRLFLNFPSVMYRVYTVCCYLTDFISNSFCLVCCLFELFTENTCCLFVCVFSCQQSDLRIDLNSIKQNLKQNKDPKDNSNNANSNNNSDNKDNKDSLSPKDSFSSNREAKTPSPLLSQSRSATPASRQEQQSQQSQQSPKCNFCLSTCIVNQIQKLGK